MQRPFSGWQQSDEWRCKGEHNPLLTVTGWQQHTDKATSWNERQKAQEIAPDTKKVLSLQRKGQEQETDDTLFPIRHSKHDDSSFLPPSLPWLNLYQNSKLAKQNWGALSSQTWITRSLFTNFSKEQETWVPSACYEEFPSCRPKSLRRTFYQG